MKSQTIVIGLDGATFDVIQPLLDAGRLPNLARLKTEGTSGKLRSVMHPESPQAWSSFLTGTNPGKHGIFGFTRRMANRYEWKVNTANDRSGPDIAEILNGQKKRVCLFNMPLTYPPRPIDGVIVSGMGTPGLDSDFTYPSELKQKLLKTLGEETWVEAEAMNKTPLEYLHALHQSIDRTLNVSKFLLQQYPDLDLYVLVFMAADRVQHFYWNYVDPHYPDYETDAPQELREAINGIYEHLDQAVGHLINDREDWNIIVMSDHGGGPFYRMVNLNRWLEQEGYLKFRDDGTSTTNHHKSDKFHYLKMSYRFFRQHVVPRLNRSHRELLRKLVPHAAMERLRGYRRNPTLHKINWAQTRAYAEGRSGDIYLNLVGREPQGIVLPEERRQLLLELSAKLLALKDPMTREAVVSQVYQGEKLFSGPYVEQSPDLLVEWQNWHYYSYDLFTEEKTIFGDPTYWESGKLRLTGNHRPNGILLMKGQPIKTGQRIDDAGIIDLAPTLLYMVGASIPKEMDGKVLLQAFKSKQQGLEPPKYYHHYSHEVKHETGQTDYTEAEATAIKDRLRDLGYLD